MGLFGREDRSRKEQDRNGTRWSHVLAEVDAEQRSDKPWWQALGTFFAWAGGFAGTASVLVVVIVLIVDLFSPDRLFTARTLSDWNFWMSTLLMLAGLVSPAARDADSLSKDKKVETPEDRETRSIRKRLRKVYDPWRWRFWAAAILSFGLSALVGLLA